ncbi:hypothetical protein, partial [Janthinobacterium sp.]|uniref:hypothetical protein n=1 Tax=Janthinobacterium sp. TaxID=1871054 RepID=UPI00293D41EB
AKPASRYSYPQLAFKLPALAPGQNSIGTGGQYSIGADKPDLRAVHPSNSGGNRVFAPYSDATPPHGILD